jgi:hypothetical protein
MDPDDLAAQAPDKLKRQKNPSIANMSPVQRSSRPLAELPAEILILICHAMLEQAVEEGKRIPDHPHDLAQLGRTCKALYLAAQDVLYREVIGGRKDYGRYMIFYRLNLSNLVCLSPRSRLFTPPSGLDDS